MPATIPREAVLCRYRYDPLDRLVDCAPSAQAGIQRFYCKSRLATEIQGAVQRSVFQHDDQLLAQLRHEDVKIDTALLATDQQRSVLNVLDATRLHPLAYTPYGHRPAENGLLSLLGFNGERPDPVTGHYLLGNGYRSFNPVLMRFNSPDSLSPFGEGGLNAYGYCGGDSINRSDPTGHFLTKFLRRIGFIKPKTKPEVSTTGTDSHKLPTSTMYYAAEVSTSGTELIFNGTNINPIPGTEHALYPPIFLDNATPENFLDMQKQIAHQTNHENTLLKYKFPSAYKKHKTDPLLYKPDRLPLLHQKDPEATIQLAIEKLKRVLDQYKAVRDVLSLAEQNKSVQHMSRPLIQANAKIRKTI